MLINQDIKNFVQGISQQPPTLRDPEQLDEQLNGYSSEAGGLQKRPPTMLVSSLARKLTKNTKPLVHFIDRDSNEKYIVLFTGDDIKVYDLQGNEKQVNFAEGTKPYIYTEKPRYNLKAITIADYTFICNTSQVTHMTKDIDDNSWNTQGLLVNIKNGQYGRTYKIVINGEEVASYETPDGSDKSHTKLINTDYIVNQLAEKCIDKGYTTKTGSSWLYLKKTEIVTETGETITTFPSTNPRQQEDRFNALQAAYLYKQVSIFVYYVASTVKRDVGIITVTVPKKELLEAADNKSRETDIQSYNKVKAEIERCQKDGWKVTQSTGTLPIYFQKGDTGDKVEAEVYTLEYAEKTETPTNSFVKSTIKDAVVYDGFNNQAAFGIIKSTQKFTNLPASAPDGFTVKITGEKGSNTDDYYVRYDTETQVWRECVRPGLKNHIDTDTMPHVLVREADGTFNFRVAEWDAREAGDEDSNPLPSFIDNTINDVFYHRNRLGFLSGENVILTCSADFFNFWMASAMEVQDTDPIDLAVSDNKIATLYHVVPFDAELILFSKDAQFALRSDNVLTPKDAYLTPPVTHFGCSLKATPVNAGRNIYFLAERSEYSTVREFFVAADNTDSKDAQDITSHVPSYIPNGTYKIAPSSVENILMFLTEGDEESMYVYKYLFIDSVRQQASWSKWSFGDPIYGASFIEDSLYIVIERNDYLCLERVSFTFNTEDLPSEPYRVLLDCKQEVTVPDNCYNELEDETQINIKNFYNEIYNPDKKYGIVAADGTFKEVAADGTVKLNGNYSGQQIICGLIYTFRMVLSTLYVKAATDSGVEAMLEGRLQIKQLWINYANSSYFTVKVDVLDKDTYEYVNTGRILGTASSTLDKLMFSTGKFTVPVQSLNTNCRITVETDAPAPVAFIGAGWIGNYVRRTKRF
jgi:hypothetical protein